MKVLMVDQFLPNSVYVVELCRELSCMGIWKRPVPSAKRDQKGQL